MATYIHSKMTTNANKGHRTFGSNRSTKPSRNGGKGHVRFVDGLRTRYRGWGQLATATLTMADGDLGVENAFTEGEYVKIIATDGTEAIFILTDSSETAVDTGTVLDGSSDIGSGTPDASLIADATCIAFRGNLNIHKQYQILNELKTAILHTNSPLKDKITAGANVGDTDGNVSIVFTQATMGASGNTTTTTNISQLTAADFTGGTDDKVKTAERLFEPGLNFGASKGTTYEGSTIGRTNTSVGDKDLIRDSTA